MTGCAVHPATDGPADAEIGWVCNHCWSRLRSLILELPAVANWLHVNQAAGGVGLQDRVSGSSEDPVPLRMDVYDLIGPDSNQPAAATSPDVLLWEDGIVVGVFNAWSEAVEARWLEILDSTDLDADVHRWQVRVTERGGCDQRGEEAVRASLRYWAGRTSAEGGFVWASWTDRNDLSSLARWLSGHLSFIAGQPWVVEMATELRKLEHAAHATVPWRAVTMRDQDPCPTCGVRAVVLHVADSILRCEERLGGCGKATVSDYLKQSRTG